MKKLSLGSIPPDQLLTEIRKEQQRRSWTSHPERWVKERLGEHIWSKQRDIFRSVAENRRTAVRSTHGSGKSFAAARVACWWLDTHPLGEAFVVTSAPTFPQVRAILWREIARAHAKGKLNGRLNQTEWFLPLPNGSEELIAFGRKPADMSPDAFQGIHSRFVLVIFDEANGIPKNLWEAADSLISNNDSRILVIGNPDDPTSEFAEVCKPGSGWNVIGISAFDTPNFTGEEVPDEVRSLLVSPTWVEEKRRKWGEGSPLWQSKIKGEFPELTHGGLIPTSLVYAAQSRWTETPPGEPVELGVDVGAGGDESVVCLRRGQVARIISADRDPDTMRTTGKLVNLLRDTGATMAKIDPIGVGRGVLDRCKEQRLPVTGVNVSLPASDPEVYANLKAEMWWSLRERFLAGEIAIDPDDDELAAQLCSLRYVLTSRGQIRIESKDDMKRRGLPSPDRADALALAFWVGRMRHRPMIAFV